MYTIVYNIIDTHVNIHIHKYTRTNKPQHKKSQDDKSNLPPISSAILPPMPAKGENLADMLKKKRTQRM